MLVWENRGAHYVVHGVTWARSTPKWPELICGLLALRRLTLVNSFDAQFRDLIKAGTDPTTAFDGIDATPLRKVGERRGARE